MTQPLIRLLIQKKLVAGRLPYNDVPRLLGGPGNGEICDGCEETVTKDQLVLESLDAAGSGVQFHPSCFQIWEEERRLRLLGACSESPTA